MPEIFQERHILSAGRPGAVYSDLSGGRMTARLIRNLVASTLLLLPAPLFAQQTGSISGKVTASDGSALPGVTVEAKSDVLPNARVTVSGATGEYRLLALPPGSYTLTFTLQGMARNSE